MKLSDFLNISAVSLIAACFLPAITSFTVSPLLPKWYLFIITISLSAVVCSLVKIFKRSTNLISDIRTVFHKLPELIVGIALCECLYTLFVVAANAASRQWVVGTFDNPAGLAVCISIAIPLVVESMNYKKTKFQVATDIVILCLYVVVLLLTKSRTAIIFLALYAAIYAFKHLRIKNIIKIVFALALTIAVAVFVVTNKKDSTTGRSFILQNSIELIKKKPVTGYGFRGFEKNYMHQQESFFRANSDSEYAFLASEINHPLNEFVYIQVNYGIFGLLAFLAVFIVPFIIAFKTKDSKLIRLQYSVLAVLIFSLFSYPFAYPLCWLVMILDAILALNAICPIVDLYESLKFKNFAYAVSGLSFAAVLCFVSYDAIQEYRWHKAWEKVSHGDVEGIADYNDLLPYFAKNYHFMHNYACELYFTEKYDEAAVIADKSIAYVDGYKTRLLAGGAYLMQKKYAEAINHFESAHYMCPSRFGPLEGLYISYRETKQVDKQKQIADLIQRMPIKVQHPEALRIKEQCK